VTGHVTIRLPIPHFLSVLHCDQTPISSPFRDIGPWRKLGHDLDPSRSRDGIGHVTIRIPIPLFYSCSIVTKPIVTRPPKPPKFAQFWWGLFRSISRLTLGFSQVNTPYSSSEPNRSVIVNRQCGGGKFKYVPKFWLGAQVTWYRACDLHWTCTLEPNISKNVRDRGLVTIKDQQEVGYVESNGHVTDDVT